MAEGDDRDVGAVRIESEPTAVTEEVGKDKGTRREIKGGIPYTTSPGVFKKALESIISAERPEKFGTDYMSTILKLTGGAARAVPPLLKKMQFIGADGTPTLLYSKFKTDNGPIVEITGLKKSDPIVRLMYSTFDAIRTFIVGDISGIAEAEIVDDGSVVPTRSESTAQLGSSLGLSYQINIVLPETENIAVFSAIFRSLRDNLLR